MQTELKKIDKLKRKIRIEIGADVLSKDKENIYKEVAKKLKVPGFRPGTAPVSVLEKHHGDLLKEELLKRIIPVYYGKALDENKLQPAGYPQISEVELTNEKLSFWAEFEIKPETEVKDDDYKNLKIKDEKIKVEAIEIEKIITQLKESVKKFVKTDYSDDMLAKWSGYPNVDILKEAMKTEIFIGKLRQRRVNIENFLAEELLRRIKVDVPDILAKEQHDKLFEQELHNLKTRGLKEEDINKYSDEMKEKLKPLAEKQVKLFYILEAIAKKESLEVDQGNIFEVVLGFILSCAEYTK